MDKNDYAVFILSHGRPDNVITYDTLIKRNYTGKIYIIVDDQDKTIDKYKENFGDKVIVFPKLESAQTTDTYDNKKKYNVVIFARNYCHKIAKDLGLKYFLELDDDYKSFEFRFNDKLDYEHKYLYNLDRVFFSIFKFLESTNIKSIALSQGGDFLGGQYGGFAQHLFLKRKCMNSFFCATDRPFKFYGRINEDVNCYVLNGARGELYFTTNHVSLNQIQTQQNSGGLTDSYLENGTYAKSFYSVIGSPSSVKINVMGTVNKRIHHMIKWDNAVPKILREEIKNKD